MATACSAVPFGKVPSTTMLWPLAASDAAYRTVLSTSADFVLGMRVYVRKDCIAEYWHL